MTELDFTKPPREDDDGPKPERGKSDRSKRRHAADIRGRLETVLTRLADSLEGRGDAELATMIREDQKAMVGGLLSVTRRVPAAAGVIVAGLSVLEPLIAFGRVFRLLLGRVADRRAAAYAEWEQQQPEDGQPEHVEQPPPPPAADDDPAPIAEPWKL